VCDAACVWAASKRANQPTNDRNIQQHDDASLCSCVSLPLSLTRSTSVAHIKQWMTTLRFIFNKNSQPSTSSSFVASSVLSAPTKTRFSPSSNASRFIKSSSRCNRCRSWESSIGTLCRHSVLAYVCVCVVNRDRRLASTALAVTKPP